MAGRVVSNELWGRGRGGGVKRSYVVQLKELSWYQCARNEENRVNIS
jgi:hypothetical protein